MFERDWILCSKNDNILDLIVNIIGGGGYLYDHFMSAKNFTLVMNKL